MSLPPTTASAPLKLTVGGAHAAFPPPAAPVPALPADGLTLPPDPPLLVVPPAPAVLFPLPATGTPGWPPLALPALAGAPLTPVTPPVLGWPAAAPPWLDEPLADGVVPGAL